MIEQLTNAISGRIKEVLQFHLNGTSEEFDAATTAVMTELSNMGGMAEGIAFTSGDLSMDKIKDRETLAKQLAMALGESNKWD
tara:strand:- start:12 stop:260 length:249 start_codon:yes stop_codon:yes gene_type:complete